MLLTKVMEVVETLSPMAHVWTSSFTVCYYISVIDINISSKSAIKEGHQTVRVLKLQFRTEKLHIIKFVSLNLVLIAEQYSRSKQLLLAICTLLFPTRSSGSVYVSFCSCWDDCKSCRVAVDGEPLPRFTLISLVLQTSNGIVSMYLISLVFLLVQHQIAKNISGQHPGLQQLSTLFQPIVQPPLFHYQDTHLD